MKVTILPSDGEVAAAVADRIVAALQAEPHLVLGLPTGRTPLKLYRELVARAGRGEVHFSGMATFNLDEFLGLAPTDPGSYRAYMERHVFGRINVNRSQINFLNGATPDPDEECARYERTIKEAGGIGLQVLGIGANGHIGFNEPGPWLHLRTHVSTLRPETRRANAALFGGKLARVPRQGLSMGMATILQGRSIVLMATGRDKAAAVGWMLKGRLTTRVPATLLHLHHDVEVMLDAAAAGTLSSDTQ